MNPKSGKAGTAIEPIAPKEAHEADKSDPSEVAEAKARQLETQTGKYGTAQVKPFTPIEPGQAGADPAQNPPPKLTWIEIELVGEDNKPIPGVPYRITLPDRSVAEGTLDHNGFARVEGFETGNCEVTFPNLDMDAWEDA